MEVPCHLLRSTMAQMSPDAIYIFDLSTNTNVYLNDKLGQAVGLCLPEMVNLKKEVMERIIHPEDLPRIMAHFARFTEMQEHDVLEVRYRLLNSEQQWRTYLARESVFKRSGEGVVTHIIGLAQDITDKAEEAGLPSHPGTAPFGVLQAVEDLAGSGRNAQHDMLSSVRKLKVFSQLLSENERSLSELGKVYLDKIRKTALRTEKLIERLLYYGAIFGDHEFDKVDLNDVVAAAKRELRLQGHALEVHMGSPLPAIRGIDDQLLVLFQELLGNASKFRKEGEEARVTINCSSLLQYDRDQSFYCIDIKDNGVGIEAEFRHRLFIPFERLHGAKEMGGDGLGLVISRRIMEHHGGGIELLEGENGCCFRLIFPRIYTCGIG